MSFNWRRPFRSREDDDDEAAGGNISDTDAAVLSDGSLQYTLEKAGNESKPSYQEASGAPVERDSPLGYEVGPITIIFLNISTMIGTGVYSTRMLLIRPLSCSWFTVVFFMFVSYGCSGNLGTLEIWIVVQRHVENATILYYEVWSTDES